MSIPQGAVRTRVLKEVDAEEFLEWASWNSEAPEALAWCELEVPCNYVPSCVDNPRATL